MPTMRILLDMIMTYVLETSVLNLPNLTSATKLANGARRRKLIATNASTIIDMVLSHKYAVV